MSRKSAWSAEHIALLGTDADGAIADRIGRTAREVFAMRKAQGIPAYRQDLAHKGAWTVPENVTRLGKAPDSVLAAELGLSNKSVQAARKARGIPPFVDRAGWDGFEGMLGKVPDPLIARIRGISRAAVAAARKARGIKSFRAARKAGEQK